MRVCQVPPRPRDLHRTNVAEPARDRIGPATEPQRAKGRIGPSVRTPARIQPCRTSGTSNADWGASSKACSPRRSAAACSRSRSRSGSSGRWTTGSRSAITEVWAPNRFEFSCRRRRSAVPADRGGAGGRAEAGGPGDRRGTRLGARGSPRDRAVRRRAHGQGRPGRRGVAGRGRGEGGPDAGPATRPRRARGPRRGVHPERRRRQGRDHDRPDGRLRHRPGRQGGVPAPRANPGRRTARPRSRIWGRRTARD